VAAVVRALSDGGRRRSLAQVQSRTTELLVIGGGPGGATVATLAARAGIEVVLIEADAHPRAHVGESLLPGIIPILEAMGALAEVEAAGFACKSGSTHFGWGRTPEWDLWFSDTDLYQHSWLVDRARFDAILLDAARRSGVEVIEHCAAKELLWEKDRLGGAFCRRRGDPEGATIRARFVVDATGQAALIARQRGLREHLPGLQHLAQWAHFEGVVGLSPPRHQQAVFVAERGHWIWFFPLAGGRASLGLISLDAESRRADGQGATEVDFDALLHASPKIAEMLGSARRVTPVRRQRDWSYRVREITGEGWMIVGDASGFIDPVLSTGVFLAMNAGYLAAKAIRGVLREGLGEAQALATYAGAHREFFDDLLRMVRFYYQQTLSLDDYFWESKRIMMTDATQLRPQKAFMILTSGLIQNLALDDLQAEQGARRALALGVGRAAGSLVGDGGLAMGERDNGGGNAATAEVGAAERQCSSSAVEREPGSLGFVCVELRYMPPGESGRGAALYFLIEPRRPAEPALARTRNWQLTCLAPRYNNDPYREPALRGPIEGLIKGVRILDDVPGESLLDFWRRRRRPFTELLAAVPTGFSVVRVFGE